MTSFAHLTTFELSIQLSPRIWQYLMLLRFYGKSDIKDYYSWWLVCGGTSHKRRSPCGLRLLPLFRVMTFGATSSRQDLFYRRTASPFALYLASVASFHKNSFPEKDFLWEFRQVNMTAASAVSSKNDMRSYVLKWQRCLYLWLSVRSLPFGVVSAPLIGW